MLFQPFGIFSDFECKTEKIHYLTPTSSNSFVTQQKITHLRVIQLWLLTSMIKLFSMSIM